MVLNLILSFVYILLLHITAFVKNGPFQFVVYIWKIICAILHSNALIVPENVAFIIADNKYLNMDFILNLALRCHNHGINTISIYDPWSSIFEKRNEILSLIQCYGPIQCSDSSLKDCVLIQNQSLFNIRILKSLCGREALVETTRQMCEQSKAIETEEASKLVCKEVGTEPDFVIKLGSACSGFAGFPSWNLRTAEIFELSRTLSYKKLYNFEMTNMINEFSGRKRRFGR